MKIYIVGTVGSGKSTFARQLSFTYDIQHIELDNIIYEGNQKRNEQKRDQLFQDVIFQSDWIIEDVGRSIFQNGLKEADKIIYLNISPWVLKKRITLRWLKQKLGMETTQYKPTIKMLKQMHHWCQADLKKRPQLIQKLQSYPAEFICLDEKTIKEFKLK